MPTEAAVLEALRPVEDPELHQSIVDLEMVKEVAIDGGRVAVTVALTVSGCPLKPEITLRSFLLPNGGKTWLNSSWEIEWVATYMNNTDNIIGFGPHNQYQEHSNVCAFYYPALPDRHAIYCFN